MTEALSAAPSNDNTARPMPKKTAQQRPATVAELAAESERKCNTYNRTQGANRTDDQVEEFCKDQQRIALLVAAMPARNLADLAGKLTLIARETKDAAAGLNNVVERMIFSAARDARRLAKAATAAE